MSIAMFTSSHGVPACERADLGCLDQLASGGEGEVYGVSADSSVVYKEYFARGNVKPEAYALARLIKLRSSIESASSRPLDSFAAWPQALVFDSSRFSGFLMPRIPEPFMVEVLVGGQHAGTRACEWNYLCRPESLTKDAVKVAAHRPDAKQLLTLCQEFARAVALLHGQRLVLGDISGRNLLWTTKDGAAIYLIDCDSFRVQLSGGVSSFKETPEWNDPELQGRPTTQASDHYKLMLAIFRAITGSGDDRPDSGAAQRLAHHPRIADLFQRNAQSGERASPDEWIAALDPRGRPTLALDPSLRIAKPQKQPSVSPGRDRPVITLDGKGSQ